MEKRNLSCGPESQQGSGRGRGGPSTGSEPGSGRSWVDEVGRLDWRENDCCVCGAFLCNFETTQRVKQGRSHIHMMRWRFVGNKKLAELGIENVVCRWAFSTVSYRENKTSSFIKDLGIKHHIRVKISFVPILMGNPGCSASFPVLGEWRE